MHHLFPPKTVGGLLVKVSCKLPFSVQTEALLPHTERKGRLLFFSNKKHIH